jgi:hypothetical protein
VFIRSTQVARVQLLLGSFAGFASPSVSCALRWNTQEAIALGRIIPVPVVFSTTVNGLTLRVISFER